MLGVGHGAVGSVFGASEGKLPESFGKCTKWGKREKRRERERSGCLETGPWKVDIAFAPT